MLKKLFIIQFLNPYIGIFRKDIGNNENSYTTNSNIVRYKEDFLKFLFVLSYIRGFQSCFLYSLGDFKLELEFLIELYRFKYI